MNDDVNDLLDAILRQSAGDPDPESVLASIHHDATRLLQALRAAPPLARTALLAVRDNVQSLINAYPDYRAAEDWASTLALIDMALSSPTTGMTDDGRDA